MTRGGLISQLTTALRESGHARAAWLGGSDAFGAADDRSDIDLVVFIHPGTHDPVHALTRETIEGAVGVEDAWRLPSPTWHGGEQSFFQASGMGNTGLVDLVTAEASPTYEFFVEERHGTPAVLFDPEGMIAPTPLDQEAHERKRQDAIERARGMLMLLGRLASKEAGRGRSIDAAHMQQRLVVGPLVDLLRARHCPDRFDFGMRYLGRDLPPDATARVERLMYPRDAAAIPGMVEEARAWGAEVYEETRVYVPRA